MDKPEALKLIEKALDENLGGNCSKPLVWYNRKWRYPKYGDSQKTCPMLQAMFDIEYHSGLIIFIPDENNKFGEPGNQNRNEEEG